MDGIYLNINQKWDTNGGYNAMLDEFYHLWRWEPKSGRQTREGLEKIGLQDVAEKLGQKGLIE